MRILVWHVHGSWMTAFVRGDHEYLVPVVPDRGPDGLGRARTYPWPERAGEVTPELLRDEDIDLVVLQRPGELVLTERWTGRSPGRDLPAVYVEHNTPRGDVAQWRHHLADRSDIPIVHVTPFNAANWDNGAAPVSVIEHGIPDPGPLWTGHLTRLALVVNEPVRRCRVAGIDLAARIAGTVPVELYGLGTSGIERLIPRGLAGVHEDLPQPLLHAAMADHRAYLHPYRWTSLGLALLEAMTIGMPVLALAATAAPEAIPAGAGTVTSNIDVLTAAARSLMADRALAEAQGRVARAHALRHFGLERFLTDWDQLIEEMTS